MKFFLVFVFVLAALAHESRLSNLLKNLVEERLAAETSVGLIGCRGCPPPKGKEKPAGIPPAKDIIKLIAEQLHGLADVIKETADYY